jgi:hypothetical protein
MWSIGTTFLSHSETVLSEIRLPPQKKLDHRPYQNYHCRHTPCVDTTWYNHTGYIYIYPLYIPLYGYLWYIPIWVYIYPMIQPHGIYIYIQNGLLLSHYIPIHIPKVATRLTLHPHSRIFNTNFIDAIYPTFFLNMLNVVSHYAIYIPFH